MITAMVWSREMNNWMNPFDVENFKPLKVESYEAKCKEINAEFDIITQSPCIGCANARETGSNYFEEHQNLRKLVLALIYARCSPKSNLGLHQIRYLLKTCYDHRCEEDIVYPLDKMQALLKDLYAAKEKYVDLNFDSKVIKISLITIYVLKDLVDAIDLQKSFKEEFLDPIYELNEKLKRSNFKCNIMTEQKERLIFGDGCPSRKPVNKIL